MFVIMLTFMNHENKIMKILRFSLRTCFVIWLRSIKILYILFKINKGSVSPPSSQSIQRTNSRWFRAAEGRHTDLQGTSTKPKIRKTKKKLRAINCFRKAEDRDSNENRSKSTGRYT